MGVSRGFSSFPSSLIFEQDARDCAQFAETKLTMPMASADLVGKIFGRILIEQARLVDHNSRESSSRQRPLAYGKNAPQQVIPPPS